MAQLSITAAEYQQEGLGWKGPAQPAELVEALGDNQRGIPFLDARPLWRAYPPYGH